MGESLGVRQRDAAAAGRGGGDDRLGPRPEVGGARRFPWPGWACRRRAARSAASSAIGWSRRRCRSSAQARNNFGGSLLLQGRVDEAIPQLQEALRLDPAHAEAHSNLGVALARRGRRGRGDRTLPRIAPPRSASDAGLLESRKRAARPGPRPRGDRAVRGGARAGSSRPAGAHEPRGRVREGGTCGRRDRPARTGAAAYPGLSSRRVETWRSCDDKDAEVAEDAELRSERRGSVLRPLRLSALSPCYLCVLELLRSPAARRS